MFAGPGGDSFSMVFGNNKAAHRCDLGVCLESDRRTGRHRLPQGHFPAGAPARGGHGSGGEGTWTRRDSGASSEDPLPEDRGANWRGADSAARSRETYSPIRPLPARPRPASASLLAGPGPRRGDGFEFPGARPPGQVFHKPIILAPGTGPELRTRVSQAPAGVFISCDSRPGTCVPVRHKSRHETDVWALS